MNYEDDDDLCTHGVGFDEYCFECAWEEEEDYSELDPPSNPVVFPAIDFDLPF
jgi:hypothetical protein